MSWVTPIGFSTINEFGSFVLTVVAKDRGAQITNVKFYVDGVLLGPGVPQGDRYTFTPFRPAGSGPFQVTALATNDQGATTVSQPKALSVSSAIAFTPPSEAVVYTDATGTGTINVPLRVIPTSRDSYSPSWQWNFDEMHDPWFVELLEDNVVVATQKYAFEDVFVPTGPCPTGTIVYWPLARPVKCVVEWPAPIFVRTSKPIGTYRYVLRVTRSPGVVWQSAEFAIAVADLRPSLTVSSASTDGQIYQGSVLLNVSASAFLAGSGITFYEGTQLIGACLLVAGACSTNWVAATVGQHTITAKATGPFGGTSTSTPLTFNVVANLLPTAVITAPARYATFKSPATITLQAAAADPDGTVTKVEFFDTNRDTSLGIATANGGNFELVLAIVVASDANVSLNVAARATDNRGARSSPDYRADTYFIVYSPLKPTIFASCGNLCYTSNMGAQFESNYILSDVASARFFRDGVFFASATSPNIFVTDPAATAGTHTYRVEVTSVFGDTASSPSQTFTVLASGPPTVAMVSPVNGATFTNVTSIPLQATASNSDGLLYVDFYRGGTTYIGTGALSDGIYTFNWSGVASGTYDITARAVNQVYVNPGQSMSAVSRIVVTTLPLSAPITSPTNGMEFPQGQSIAVTAGSAGANPAIVSIELWRAATSGGGTAQLLTSTAGGALDYTLAASPSNDVIALYTVAINAQGGRTQSPTVTFTVRSDVTDPRYFVWTNMNAALKAGNKATALTYLTPTAQSNYDGIFDALMPSIAPVISSYSAIVPVNVTSDAADYLVARTIGGQRLVFGLRFVLTDDGRWKLDGL